MRDRTAELLGLANGQGNDLGDLLGREGRGSTRSGLIGEHVSSTAPTGGTLSHVSCGNTGAAQAPTSPYRL